MISIQTAYPCPKCKRDIPPRVDDKNKFCSYCGTEQQNIDTRSLWNIFSRFKGVEIFNMTYAGSPILTFEDAQELVFENEYSENYEMYVASYLGSALRERNPDNNHEYTLAVKTWQKRGFRGLESDQGPRTITITTLE